MIEPLSPERLDEIQRSIPEAYTAPWTVHHGDDECWRVGYATTNPLAGLVATVPDYGANLAEFIALARTAVPELVVEINRLRAELYRALGDELNPSRLVLDAQAYTDLRDDIEGTMTDPDRWDEDAAEPAILGRYVKWLATQQTAQQEQLRQELVPAWEAVYEPGNVSDYLIGYANDEEPAKAAAASWFASQYLDEIGRLEWAEQVHGDDHTAWFDLIHVDPELGEVSTGITVRCRVKKAAPTA